MLVDFALTGGLSMFFDLWFVVICLVGAMAVRRQDLFTAGVLAPLLFGGLIAVISLVAPATFSEVGGFGKVFPDRAHGTCRCARRGIRRSAAHCRRPRRQRSPDRRALSASDQRACSAAFMSRRSSGGSAKINDSSAVWTALAAG